MVAVRRANELDRDPQPIAVLSYATVEHGLDVECGADLTHVSSLSLELKCRRSCGHAQPMNLRQGVDQFFGHAIAKTLLILRRAHITEWQDGDRWDTRFCPRSRVSDSGPLSYRRPESGDRGDGHAGTVDPPESSSHATSTGEAPGGIGIDCPLNDSNEASREMGPQILQRCDLTARLGADQVGQIGGIYRKVVRYQVV